MNKKKLDEAVQLTRETLDRFWQKDIDFVIQHFAENVIWVGSEQSEFKVGYQESANDFKEMVKNLQPCHLENSSFYVVSNSGDSCVVVGKYLTTTDSDVDYFLQVQQRATFVWEYKNSEYKIKHLHISNPMGELKITPGERFVNAIGKMSYKYMEKQLSHITNKQKITVNDENGAIRFVYLNEIMYLESDRKITKIFTLDDVINAKISFSDVYEMLSDDFIQVHRCYTVNKNYITHVITNGLIMSDKKHIPIPMRKFSEIKTELMKDID